ncbi:hypothetical protein [Priestia megaterium]|uniref:hypothetical protein n=1 Tax=Priestia megaterium TaxID=1404 RepID=UPI000BFB30CA|nr:hypothetical protein [Priestia megaterium]PGY51516.1 hypothetical protein COE35_13580 [Priestia megaterium]
MDRRVVSTKKNFPEKTEKVGRSFQMGRNTKTVNNMTSKLSKLERQERQKAEEMVLNDTKTPPTPTGTLKEAQKVLFDRYSQLNDNFSESDSTSLTALTRSVYRQNVLIDRLEELDELDEQAAELERRIHAYERSIVQQMNLLCIPLNQRLRLANDVAKLAIEEKKLANMEAPQVQEVNPLLAVLEARKHAK